MARAIDVIEVASGELGYKEQGVNRTKYGKEYGTDGQYWCAIFVWWCFRHAGCSSLYYGGKKTAYTPNLYHHYHTHGQTSKTPRIGDLILLKRDGVKQVVGHVGIVTGFTNKFVYSIEGNSGNMVKTVRRYRTDSHIVTYAHPKYSTQMNWNTHTPTNPTIATAKNSSSRTSAGGVSSGLASIGKALGANTSTDKYSMAVNASWQTAKAIGRATESLGTYDVVDNPTVDAYPTLFTCVQEGTSKVYYYLASEDNSVVEGDIEWDSERKGAPGKLVFTCLKDSSYKLVLGAPVGFSWGSSKVFFGFIFSIKESSDNKVEVTCYDQMRYLKNKHTYTYKKKSATSVIKMIARDFKLNTGSIADTKYAIPQRIENDQTLFDIIQTALDLTLIKTGKMYTLWDKYGKLRLSLIQDRKISCFINVDTVGKWDASQSIDSDVYNKVRVTVKGENGKKDKVYIQQSSDLMNKWGVLQYTETQESAKSAKTRAKDLLSYYKIPKRTLNIDEVIGDTSARAGTLVPVKLNAARIDISNYMLIERAKHTFTENRHVMTLDLIGDGFDAQ